MTQTADTATEKSWHICALVKSADGSEKFPLEQDAPNEPMARKLAKASSLFDGRAHIHTSAGIIANYVNGEEVKSTTEETLLDKMSRPEEVIHTDLV